MSSDLKYLKVKYAYITTTLLFAQFLDSPWHVKRFVGFSFQHSFIMSMTYFCVESGISLTSGRSPSTTPAATCSCLRPDHKIFQIVIYIGIFFKICHGIRIIKPDNINFRK